MVRIKHPEAWPIWSEFQYPLYRIVEWFVWADFIPDLSWVFQYPLYRIVEWFGHGARAGAADGQFQYPLYRIVEWFIVESTIIELDI